MHHHAKAIGQPALVTGSSSGVGLLPVDRRWTAGSARCADPAEDVMLSRQGEVTGRAQDDPTVRRPLRIVKRVAIDFSILVAILTASDFGYRYWTVGSYLGVTDDAYVKADYTTVAPKVSGHIAEVLVADNEQVTVGQTLARIDERDLANANDRRIGQLLDHFHPNECANYLVTQALHQLNTVTL